MATNRSGNAYARHGNSSPEAGSYVQFVATFDAILTSTTRTKKIQLPAGMKVRVVAATARCSAVASDPAVSVGSFATVTKYAAATNLTTSLGALTMVSANQESAAGETLAVQVVADSGDTATDVVVNVTAFVTAHPTAAPGS